jgi:hypothetical protein
MPGGTSLVNFPDFMKATGPAYLSSAEAVINEAAKRTYVLGLLLRGRGLDEILQGGSKIKDTLMFDDASTYQHFRPNATFSWQMPQVLTEWEINWRFSLDHLAWNETTVRLNVDKRMTKDAQKVQYKRLKRTIEQRMWTSMYNGIENDLWASPHGATNYGQMEGASGELPYSIPSFITEEANALPNGWTNVMGINPATETRWQNYRGQYNFNDPADAGGNYTGLFDLFDAAFQQIKFQPPDVTMGKDSFEALKMSKLHILTSYRGERLYKRLLRDSNDTLVSQQDPAYNRPMNAGVQIRGIEQLGNAALYNNGSGTFVSEMNAQNVGPRFYLINGEYLGPVFHSEAYMERLEAKQPTDQVDAWVIPTLLFWNLVCKSRQRHAIIYPGG